MSRGRGVVLFHDEEFAYLVTSWPARVAEDGERDLQVVRVGSNRKIAADSTRPACPRRSLRPGVMASRVPSN